MIGDTTYFIVENDNGDEKDRRIFDFIKSSPSVESAWQIYLLSRSENIMPTFWHGGYRQRVFIFDEDIINDIIPLRAYDPTPLSQNNLLLPEVILSADSREADIFCTYWNDWKGLVREHVKIYFHDDRKVTLEECEPLTLFYYNCGIVF